MAKIVLQSDIDQQYQKLRSLTDGFSALSRELSFSLSYVSSAFKRSGGKTTIISTCRLQSKYLIQIAGTLHDGAELLRLSKDTLQNLDTTIRQEINNQSIFSMGQLSFGDTSSDQIVATADGAHNIEFNGGTYRALNYEQFILSQNDYDGECFGYGYNNEGCTATSWCMGLSMITGQSYNPTDAQMWINGVGATFKGQGTSVWGNQAAMLSEAYNQLQNGKPSVFYGYHSYGNGGCMHAVTIVGISESADINNLQMSDFLVIDPWGGEVKTLDQVNYTGFPSGSRLITYSDDLP